MDQEQALPVSAMAVYWDLNPKQGKARFLYKLFKETRSCSSRFGSCWWPCLCNGAERRPNINSIREHFYLERYRLLKSSWEIWKSQWTFRHEHALFIVALPTHITGFTGKYKVAAGLFACVQVFRLRSILTRAELYKQCSLKYIPLSSLPKTLTLFIVT